MRNPIIPFIPMTVWALIIFVFSALPSDTIQIPSFWNMDKIIHVVIYFVLAVLLLMGLFMTSRSISFTDSALLTLLAVVAYGGLMELLQQYVFITRHGDFLDFAANSVGAILGIFAVSFYLKKT